MENFRTQYFNNLGLKDLALQGEVVDISKLKQLVVHGSSRTVDKSNRISLWELLLGIVPPFKCVKLHVSEQQREQWTALTCAARLLNIDNDDRSWWIYQIHLIHIGKMPLNFPLRRRAAAKDECRAVLIEVILSLEEESKCCKLKQDRDEMSAYFIVHEILSVMSTINADKVRDKILLLIKEKDQNFAKRLNQFDVPNVISGLVDCCFVKSLNICCMATLLDKVIGGARAMLVHVGADLLFFGYSRLRRSATHEALAEELRNLRYTHAQSNRYCLRGAIESWEKAGRPYEII